MDGPRASIVNLSRAPTGEFAAAQEVNVLNSWVLIAPHIPLALFIYVFACISPNKSCDVILIFKTSYIYYGKGVLNMHC